MARRPTPAAAVLGVAVAFASSTSFAEEVKASAAASLESTVDELPPVTEHAAVEAPSSATRVNVILSGLLVTGGFYGVSFASSLGWQDWQGAEAARIPFVGPFLALGRVPCRYSNPEYDPNLPSEDGVNPANLLEPGCDTGDEVFRAILAGVSAVGQLGGLALIAEGFWMPTSEPVSSGAYSVTHVAALPVLTPTTIGLSFRGAF